MNTGLKNPSEFPEFTVESTDQVTKGYYILDVTPFIAIIDHFGKPLFYRDIPGGSSNFERQPDGSYSYYSYSAKGFLVMNEYFQMTDTFVRVGENLINFHEFNILENGNYIVLGYDRRVVNMSQYVDGGQEFATVTGMIFQELDPDKNLLFEWNSWDHISFLDCDPALVDLTGQVIDYIHPNSIVLDSDGNFLLTSRHLSEVTKIDRLTGAIIWRMGGVKNEFDFVNDTMGFSGPHSAIRLPNGNIALLDNGEGREQPFSRGVEYVVDEVGKTTTQVQEYRASPDLFSLVMGNVTSLPGNHLLVGWGKNLINAVMSEFDEGGELVTSMSLPLASTYSTYKVSWMDRFDFFVVPGEDTLDFGEVETGDSVVLNVELSNQGLDPATLIAFIDASGQCEIVDEMPFQIPEGATEQVSLKFKPTAPGNYSAPVYLYFRLDSTILDDHMIACRLMLEGYCPIPSSSRETREEEVLIFPNPFKDQLTIDHTRDVESIVIWSITGRKVLQLKNNKTGRRIFNVSQLPVGIYVVEIILQDSTREYMKVVKGGENE